MFRYSAAALYHAVRQQAAFPMKSELLGVERDEVRCGTHAQGSQEARENLLAALLLLQLMWRANEGPPPRIALNEFYNKALSDSMDVQAEYVAWRQNRVSGPQSIWCCYDAMHYLWGFSCHRVPGLRAH